MDVNDAVQPRSVRSHSRLALLAALYAVVVAAGPCGLTDSGGKGNATYKGSFNAQWVFSQRLGGTGCDIATTDSGTVSIVVFNDASNSGSFNRNGNSFQTGVTAVGGGHCTSALTSHTTADGGTLVVNGSNLSFTYTSPASTTADGYTGFYTLTFSGVLSNGVVTGTMTQVMTTTGNGITSGGTMTTSLTLH